MAKKTFEERLNEDPSAQFYKLLKGNVELIFACYEGDIQGIIEENFPYELKLSSREEPLHKTDFLYFYAVEYDAAVKRSMEIDAEIANQQLQALYQSKGRKFYRNSLIRRYSQEGKPMKVTLRNGHTFKGHILSFGIFSFLLKLSDVEQVMILKHSIHELDYA